MTPGSVRRLMDEGSKSTDKAAMSTSDSKDFMNFAWKRTHS